ncbi:hypothetical protein Q8A67_005676 [Cirrhinus molitorella]|uniref:Uncharacterized protein n=1 Tax=Cirrhinus molitorella TaxID=172907 RepID=A0AA88PZF0_9TELE|nr:hypothetical protein Q8A67_005676 [Cirrhinus molitorella]
MTAATINRDPAAEINTIYNKGSPDLLYRLQKLHLQGSGLCVPDLLSAQEFTVHQRFGSKTGNGSNSSLPTAMWPRSKVKDAAARMQNMQHITIKTTINRDPAAEISTI